MSRICNAFGCCFSSIDRLITCLHWSGRMTDSWMLVSALPVGPRWQRARVGGQDCLSSGWQCEVPENLEDFFLATSVLPQLVAGPRQGHAEVSRMSHGRFAVHVLSHFSSLSFRRSGLSSLSSVVCGSLCPPLRAHAGVAVLSTSLDHCASCTIVGVLGRRGFTLESAAARVC